ncbi:Putative iron-sulfur cluster assembly scaffold protein for SUF system, SufE2 [uncultured Candidatus Thioglobus sp.]|nr:Putative iron-sulfur cluster assembly scaffold protein for SUF system, SufE2 [uncultured Candidatus Thioglobus sp.]
MKELYQEVIVDHNRNPRNFGKLEHPTQISAGYNPLCGDKLSLYLKIEQQVITDVSFDGSGCAISVASSSLMTDALKGKTIQQADELFQEFYHLMIDTENSDTEKMQKLGKLSVLFGVRAYPARVKCATLCWHAMQAGLHEKNSTPATTE